VRSTNVSNRWLRKGLIAALASNGDQPQTYEKPDFLPGEKGIPVGAVD